MRAVRSFFGLDQAHTTVRTEICAGVTTFATMSYIIVVNPGILQLSGMDFGAVMTATCLASAFGTLLMGLLANYPIALAPAMGHNVYFAFTACVAVSAGGVGCTWQQALGAVFIAGLVFLALSLVRFRERIIDAIPRSLKLAIGAGIGLMVAFLGLAGGGFVVKGEGTLTRLGSLAEPTATIAVIGLIVTAACMVLRIPGSILVGMVFTSFLCLGSGLVTVPERLLEAPPSLAPTLMQMQFENPISHPRFLILVATFLYLDMFDTVGTLVGVGERAGMLKGGKLPRAGRALASDAAATSVGAMLGTSTVTSYIESSAGIATGGRTGLANVVTALLFLLALPLAPMVKMVGGGIEIAEGTVVNPITAPALILIGCMMMGAVRRIAWDDYSEAVPAFITMLIMPLDMNISAGISAGFITYVVLKMVQGKARSVHPLTHICALAGLAYFVYLR